MDKLDQELKRSQLLTYFRNASVVVHIEGYKEEVDYVRGLSFEKCTPEHFFEQYAWCVLNAGMKEQIARKIWERYLDKLDPLVIGHLGKREAIERGLLEYGIWFEELKHSKDPVQYLETLPWIGPITKYHLARNIGFDCVKPDRHLVKLAARFGYPTPLEMCIDIQKSCSERLGVIDVILWRYCNLTGDV